MCLLFSLLCTSAHTHTHTRTHARTHRAPIDKVCQDRLCVLVDLDCFVILLYGESVSEHDLWSLLTAALFTVAVFGLVVAMHVHTKPHHIH